MKHYTKAVHQKTAAKEAAQTTAAKETVKTTAKTTVLPNAAIHVAYQKNVARTVQRQLQM